MKSKNIIGVGIDVSKVKIDVVFLDTDGREVHRIYDNTKPGITKLVGAISGYEKKIVMESTGRYHLLAALILEESGFDVRVINPLLPRKYVVSRIRKNKTDKADAGILAEIAAVEKKLPMSFKATREDIKVRQKIGLVCTLENNLQKLRATEKNYSLTQNNLSLGMSKIEESLKASIKNLEKAKKGLEKEISDLLQNKGENIEKQKLLTSIPGISLVLANLVLHFLDEENYPKKKQWIGFVGLDVSQKQSGQWKGRGRISKRGNCYLRKRLFCGAWGATMTSELFNEYYKILKNKGRLHKEALTIISRKLLCICQGVLKNRTPFLASKCNFS